MKTQNTDKPKTHTLVLIPGGGGKWTRISRKQCKCAAAWEVVQSAFSKK